MSTATFETDSLTLDGMSVAGSAHSSRSDLDSFSSACQSFGDLLGVPSYAEKFSSTTMYAKYVTDVVCSSSRSANEQILSRGAAAALDNTQWRVQLKTKSATNPTAAAAMTHRNRGLAPWRWRMSSQPVGCLNVEVTDRFRAVDAALSRAGTEYSGPSHSLIKSDKHGALRGVYSLWSIEDRRWLSWLREARCVLSLREFAEHAPIYRGDGTERHPPATRAQNHAGLDFRVQNAVAPAVNVTDAWAAALLGLAQCESDRPNGLAPANVPFVRDVPAAGTAPAVSGPVYRRDSVTGVNNGGIDFVWRGDFALGFSVRVVWQDELGDWVREGRTVSSADDYFVSRASNLSEFVYDFWALYVDEFRLQVQTCPGASEVTMLVPNLVRVKASQDLALSRLGGGRWHDWRGVSLILGHQRVARVGASVVAPACDWTSMTGRDLFALTSYLTLERITQVVPFGRDVQLGVESSHHSLWWSPVSVRLASVYGWVVEMAPPHSLRVTYVPSGAQLDRMLRFQAMRMGYGFDMCWGLSLGNGALYHHVGQLGHVSSAFGQLLFNLCYGTADGVSTGWWFRWEVCAPDPNFDPSDRANPMTWGLRRRWRTFGLPVQSREEWDSPTASDTAVNRSNLDDKRSVLPLSDSTDSSHLFRASYMVDLSLHRPLGVDVVSSSGFRERWYFSLQNVAPTRASPGFHWFSIPSGILFTKDASRGVVNVPELTRGWWPDDGVYVTTGTALGSVGFQEVDSDTASRF